MNKEETLWRGINSIRPLIQYLFACIAGLGCLLPIVSHAHPLDVAYFDIAATPTSTSLTVAVHPYQAFELVRGGEKIGFDLQKLAARADLIAAYVTDHVTISAPDDSGSNWKSCSWESDAAIVPSTELDAVADGVTVVAPLKCQTEFPSSLRLSSDIFLDGFPQQSNIVRLELPEGFAEVGTMNTKNPQLEVKLTRTHSTIPASAAPVSKPSASQSIRGSTPRTQDAALANIAKQILDPGLGLWGFLLLLVSVMGIGALHALGPGHGKSLMAAMLVGENATFGKVLALGTVMTVTHISDVFILAVLAGFISAVLPPITLIRWLEIASAIGLIIFGGWNFIRALIRYREARSKPETAISNDAHERAHLLGLPHAHAADHSHTHEEKSSFKKTLWLGFVGSIAPCPTAWAIFMATLSAGKAFAGIALLVAFTIGLHATILVIGFLLITSKRFALKRTPVRFTYALPIISATLIVLLGSYLALSNLGIIG